MNAFVRVIPADRHIGAVGKIRRGGLLAGRGNKFRVRPSVGEGGRAGTSAWLLGAAAGNLSCSPGLVALPEGYTLNSEQGCLFFL